MQRGLKVKRILFRILAGMLLAVPAWSQETVDAQSPTENPDVVAVDEFAEIDDTDDTDDTDEADEADGAEEIEAVEENFDEAGLDEQGFDDKDDDFRPTEEIPTDQSIPFPTDI